MFLYARPWSVICPVCDGTMISLEKVKYACLTPTCRMFERWFEIQLPILTAHACTPPAKVFT